MWCWAGCRTTRRRGNRALLATLLQTGALWLALRYGGTLSRPAALACTILPPLAFVTARQQDTDGALGLFLSFCVLLVGVILDGVHTTLVFAYGLTACVALRTTAHVAACRVSRAPHRQPSARRTAHVFGSALALALPCLLAAFAVDGAIGLLPSPSRTRHDATAGSGTDGSRRRVGLDDSFVLDGSHGVLSDLHGEQLVRVTTADGQAVPPDLYLRSGFFAEAGLERWRIGKLEQELLPAADRHPLREPSPRTGVQWLEIERYAGARNFLFAPPGAVEIHCPGDLIADRAREWLRQVDRNQLDAYEIGYQTLPPPAADQPVDPRARSLGLLALPVGLDRARCEQLLDAWHVGRDPRAAAEAVADGLARHCRYDRAEPVGPFAHTLENFLFAADDRRGYCMHFASAAALLLRLRGIPCRIGVGLYGGDQDRREPGARVFGSQHAHAWIEIPFAGRGFVVFDPTPPQERGQRMPSRTDDKARLEAAAAAAGATTPGTWRALLDFLLQPWLLLVALLAAIASTLWPTGPARRAPVPVPPIARSARRLLARLLRALDAAGHARGGATLERFAQDLAARHRLLPEIAAAFATYQEVRFGGRPLDDARTATLQRGVAAAEAMLARRADERQPTVTAGQT